MRISPEPWQHALVREVIDVAEVCDASALASQLRGVLDDRACDALASRFSDLSGSEAEVPRDYRRAHGVFFTPPQIADRIASRAVEPTDDELVVDLSCGDAELLRAIVDRAPGTRVVGVERELVFAVAAAERLVRSRGRERGDRIIWGDGLQHRDALRDAIAVVGNPPYVGEKGNGDLFTAVRRTHPDLEQYFAPRIDLHYLFVHRGLDLLRPAGRLVYLTSEYWLTATGAANLREDLSARGVVTSLERLGSGAFDDAPGHHSLLLTAIRKPTKSKPVRGVRGRAPWHPFAEIERSDGVALGEICQDRQGFVSGADRVTARIAKKLDGAVEVGAPIFLYESAEVPEGDRDLFRPVLRRSECMANHVYLQPPGNEFVLWSDGTESTEDAQRVEVLLEPFRPLLADRREARLGTMPWRRVWWPRRTAEYLRPKLVVPRRATEPSLSLDMSGSFVSSDCTFLLAPDHVDDEVRWLLTVMLIANSEVAAEQLRAFGKTKGAIMEFYSEPLRAWRLPADLVDGELIAREPRLAQAVERAVETIAGARETSRSSFEVAVEEVRWAR